MLRTVVDEKGGERITLADPSARMHVPGVIRGLASPFRPTPKAVPVLMTLKNDRHDIKTSFAPREPSILEDNEISSSVCSQNGPPDMIRMEVPHDMFFYHSFTQNTSNVINVSKMNSYEQLPFIVYIENHSFLTTRS